MFFREVAGAIFAFGLCFPIVVFCTTVGGFLSGHGAAGFWFGLDIWWAPAIAAILLPLVNFLLDVREMRAIRRQP